MSKKPNRAARRWLLLCVSGLERHSSEWWLPAEAAYSLPEWALPDMKPLINYDAMLVCCGVLR